MSIKSLIAKMLILSVFMIMLTGCWNRRELNTLGIVSAIGLDKKGDKIIVSAQVLDPGEIATTQQGRTGRVPVTLYQEAESNSVFEAMRKMTTNAPRKLYFSHVMMVVISEKLAKDGINKVLDFFSRDHEFRTDFYLVIIKNKEARQVLNVLTFLDRIPANKLHDSLETSSNNWAPINAVKLDQLMNDLMTEGKNLVLTGLRVSGDLKKGESTENVERIDSPAQLQFSRLAAFKKDKLAGWLNEEESRGYNYVEGTVKESVNAVACPKKGSLTVEIIRSRTKLKAKVEKGKPHVNVNVWVEGNVGEVNCQIDLLEGKNISKIETQLEQTLEKSIQASIKKAQKRLKSDIFGFGDLLHRKQPKLWKKLKINWEKEFVDLPVNVKVTAKIRRTGTTSQSFIEETKE